MDIQSILLDEIALEGLDGITLPTLFVRLKQVDGIQLDFDEKSVQEYVWKSILSIIKRIPHHLKLYQLPEQRPPFELYDKYEHHNSYMFYEDSDGVPQDIYSPLAPVEGKTVRGSCIEFTSRIDVTIMIVEDSPSLDQILIDYNESLVIVASQDLRDRSLGITSLDPGSNLSDKIYCYLEKVGRMRRLGLSTVGKEGVLEVLEKDKGSNEFISKFVKSKDAFYFRRTICNRKLAKTSPFYINANNVSLKGHVVFLTRFYTRSMTPLENIAIKTSAFLEEQPDQESDIPLMIQKFPEHNSKAFSHLFGTYPKVFSVFYREFEKSNLTKKSKSLEQVVKRKFVKLIKPFSFEEDDEEEEVQENVEEDEDDEIQEGSSLTDTFYKPDVILADRTLLSQVLALIETAGDEGLSLVEIGKQLSLGRLDSRSVVRILMMTKSIKSVKVDNGRNRVTRFIPLVKFEKSRQELLAANEKTGFKPEEETLVTAKRANCILELLERDLIVTGVVPFRKRILAMEKDKEGVIDRSSIKTIIAKLAATKKLRTEKVVIETLSGQRCEQMFVISSQLPPGSDLINERINQWKFQLSGLAQQSPVKQVKRRHLLSRDENSESVSAEAFVCQPSIGKKYGAEPKMVKSLTFYRFLHHLLFTLPNDNDPNYDDWRKHVKPLPDAQNGPTCLLGDVAPRLPLSVFVRIIYLTHVIPGLEEYLNDPEKCHLPISDLPIEIQCGLTHRRKYLYSLFEGLKILQLMNLAEVEHKLTDAKESARIILKNEISFKDKDIVAVYKLDTDEDIETFQDDLRVHCTSTCYDCSLAPELFVHNLRNWIDSSKPRLIPALNAYHKKILSLTNEIFLVKSEERKQRKRVSEEPISRNSKKTKKNDISSHNVIEESHNVINESHEIPKQTSLREKRRMNDDTDSPKKRVKIEDDVDIEALKLLKVHRNRSVWTQEEDSFLILARTASLLLDPGCNTSLCVPGQVVRNELHKDIQHARDKTSRAVQRRIIFLTYKDPVLKSRINEWVVELKQDDDFYAIQRPKVPKTDEKVWKKSYLDIFCKLKQKYEQPFTSNFKPSHESSVENATSIDDYEVKEASLDTVLGTPTFCDPQNFVEVYIHVVLNVLLSTLILNDEDPKASQKFSKTLFNIYRRYPDSLIRACVTRLSKGNLMSKFKEKRDNNVNKKTVSNMIIYQLSAHFNFILGTKYRISSLINSSVAEGISRSVEGPSEALALTSLASSRSVKYEVEIPEEILSFDEETKKRLCLDQLDMDKSLDNSNSSRSMMASFRSQYAQRPELNERYTAENFILNKCKVTTKLGIDATIPSQFEESWKYLTKELCENKSKTPKNDPLLNFIENKQVIGASLEQIQSFKPGITEKDLRKLEDKYFIYRLGVNTFRWVHRDHIIVWVATDFNPSKKNSNSTIKFFPKVWRKPDGSINSKIIFKFLSAIVAHVLTYPGISESRLVEYFQKIAPGTQIREFIELLMAAGCLNYIQQLSLPCDGHVIHTSDRWIETTTSCILILSKLKNRLDC